MSWLYKITLVLVSFPFISYSEIPSATDEASIKNVTSDYVQAFNQHDADKLTSLWAPDANYVNLTTHETLQGEEEIKRYFDNQLKDKRDSILEITIDNIQFNQQGNAIEKGTAIVKVKDQPENKSFFLAELTRTNNTWALQKVIELEDIPPSLPNKQLKDLDWLLGKWKSQTEYADLSLNIEWGENKHFLSQNFIVTVLEQKIIDGKQIIGWDPINKKVFSWMIDSDGGYGESSWRQQGEQWYVSLSFTLSDGRRASATHIYKKIDENTFTFASENRDLDGKILPDIKPITFKKI